MKFFLSLIFLLAFVVNFSQDLHPSEVETKSKSFTVPFELINNLIVIEVEVNNSATVNLILDTGSGYTLVTDYTNIDNLIIKEGKTLQLGGLGREESVTLYDSRDNVIKVGSAILQKSQILLLLDSDLKLSERMGIPVHGVIGYELLKGFVVRINYLTKRLTFYTPEYFKQISSRRFRKYETTNFDLHLRKPYVQSSLQIHSDSIYQEKLMLLDTGGWDSFWLISRFDESLVIPTPNYQDTLGVGLNGTITGRRGRIESVRLFNSDLQKIPGAFPDSASTQNLVYTPGRKGSFGGEILSRYHLILDYPSGKVYHRPNRNINRRIQPDLSGISIIKPFYNLPIVEISHVRPDSPAFLADIRAGDFLEYINGEVASKRGLNNINEILREKVGKKITVSLRRDGKILRKSFRLEDPFSD